MGESRMPDYFGVPSDKLGDYVVDSEEHKRLGVSPAIIIMDGKPAYPQAFTLGEIANMVELSVRTLFEQDAVDEQTERAAMGDPIIPLRYPTVD